MLLLPIVAQVSSPLSWLCPLPGLVTAYQKREVDTVSALPFLLAILQYLSWSLYGHKTGETTLAQTSLQALCLYTLYLLSLFYYQNRPGRVVGALLLVMVYFMYLQMFPTLTIGLLSALFQILACSTNLASLASCLSQKCSSSLNKQSIRVSLPNSVVWVLLALECDDLVILIPNICDTCVNLSMFLLYLYFPDRRSYIPVTAQPDG